MNFRCTRFMLVNLLVLVMVLQPAGAQSILTTLRGNITDAASMQPLEGINVTLMPGQVTGMTDQAGNFHFMHIKGTPESIVISSIGYETRTVSLADLKVPELHISLNAQNIALSTVTVSSQPGEQYRSISKADIAMRGVNNSQEVLRIIPGMVISQHQGGGKAEQILVRGFDADHGTDLREDVDGMPINMSSHAHGQGYADSHFIIPETIESVNFKKGPYTAAKGDFCTTGFVDFNTRESLPGNSIKAEGGMFNTFRFLGLFNLLREKARARQQSWYAASEYGYSDGYFDNPQHFKRFNLFTKYNGKISEHHYLTVSATTFRSKWSASGQIPDRAVSEHIIGFYGAIDPSEGGETCRTNVNVALVTSCANGDLFRNQVFYSNYHFDLHTNFTFFLVDTINGDEIGQKEARDLFGYNGSYEHTGYTGATKVTTEAGVNIRQDLIHHSGLSHTLDRLVTLQQIKLGDINVTDIASYASETFTFNERFSINAGLRFDKFFHQYDNKTVRDITLPGIGTYKESAHTISPKLNIYYHLNGKTQFYLTTGRGFHSNDARVAVVKNGSATLPAVYGVDLGTAIKPLKDVLVNACIWYIYLQQEFVYNGDGGDVGFSGRTRRVGFDLSGRYQPARSVYIDLDLNYSHGRAPGNPKGAAYIPLAPVWTSAGGVTYTRKNGFNGSLRYRMMGNRPANEDYSLKAVGYFVADAVINFTRKKYEIGFVINNILNTKWKEAQFDTTTRLKGEAQPVDEICFTPGTPLGVKLRGTFNF
ncbi:TonB-dependent receptor plug domain-containing protein [Flavitalea sp. BT771]|uniref:TonB-dependent receptor n=1 Tax=Flavitalea sp. BT771 TaxID=3063329 RepID=UPI0026E34FE8|nr:TonB-dependent receptor [Flavitalea sp. BT771]MDO6434776.1 TonB-dependent receptor plug domain-containing protein [Flavitalea sp. BT771]MDV6223676.1 TonB-dependent receptor plug domain-containing protein [Flavitalea sp. BT771]